jgi:hypothetical protein
MNAYLIISHNGAGKEYRLLFWNGLAVEKSRRLFGSVFIGVFAGSLHTQSAARPRSALNKMKACRTMSYCTRGLYYETFYGRNCRRVAIG